MDLLIKFKEFCENDGIILCRNSYTKLEIIGTLDFQPLLSALIESGQVRLSRMIILTH